MKNALRYIAFVLLSVITVSAFDWLLAFAIYNISSLSKLWIILIMVFGYSLILSIGTAVVMPLLASALAIAPNKKIAAYVIGITAVVSLIYNCFTYYQFASAASFTVFGYIVMYINVLIPWGGLIGGVFSIVEEE